MSRIPNMTTARADNPAIFIRHHVGDEIANLRQHVIGDYIGTPEEAARRKKGWGTLAVFLCDNSGQDMISWRDADSAGDKTPVRYTLPDRRYTTPEESEEWLKVRRRDLVPIG